MSRGARSHGLSLIELVVAMALFALVAVMGTQSLTGMLWLRDDLTARSARAEALTWATALLRADLSAALPMLFYPPGAPPRSALVGDARGFAVSLGGQPVLSPGPDGLVPGRALQRAEWRLDPGTGRLTRRQWAVLAPADDTALGPEMPVLDGVTALHLRSYWPQTGWVRGLTAPDGVPAGDLPQRDGDAPGAAPEVYSSALPAAVELTLDLGTGGTITLLESLR